MKTRSERAAVNAAPRRVLVIGASASLGPDLVEGFCALGDDVLATTRSGALAGVRDTVQVESLDLLDTASLDRLAVRVMQSFGALDVAVFLAGILPGKALATYDDALMQQVMSSNFTAQAALAAFVKSLATWLAPGLRVNALAPALIEGSAMFEAMAPGRRSHHLASTPTGRLSTPAELAAVIVNLCEPAWSNLNGQVIRINGGAHV